MRGGATSLRQIAAELNVATAARRRHGQQKAINRPSNFDI
jgi:hypothetical protein